MKKLLFIIGLFLCYQSISIAQETKEKKFKVSFSARARLTTVDKAITLDKNKEVRTYTRWRTYLGAEYKPNKHLGFKLQIGNEARIWMSPPSKKSSLNEIFVNQLYVDYKNIANLPLDLRIGRQEIFFDEKFICADANPAAGSRSKYFNAIKTVWRINNNNEATAFFSYNSRRDELLPIIHEKDPYKVLEEQTNTGLGVYYKSKIRNIKLSAYYFHKKYFEYENFPDGHTHAIGSRIVAPFLNNFVFTTELAYQFGKVGAFNRQGYGGYSRLEYNFDSSIPIIDQISTGAVYLSGDNPNTEKVEGWDPLWSRWPKWSESYAYTIAIENKGRWSYWSNINAINFAVHTTLAPNVKFRAEYYLLTAPQSPPKLKGDNFFSQDGKIRGNLYTMKLTYQIDPKWSGHLMLEHFSPGNFYIKEADKYNWVRFQLMYEL